MAEDWSVFSLSVNVCSGGYDLPLHTSFCHLRHRPRITTENVFFFLSDYHQCSVAVTTWFPRCVCFLIK